MPAPLRLAPSYKHRVWGGGRFGPGIGEAWFEHPDLPLLIKVLDTADWLSLQLHPDDEQAARLEGPGCSGKAEAWHILEARTGAEVISGLKPDTTRADLERALAENAVLDLVQRLPVQPGDTLYNPPGLVHALGPGILVYEVQQRSDITYRLWDWGRPASKERPLHLEQSLACVDLAAQPTICRAQRGRVAAGPHFTLDLIADSVASIGALTHVPDLTTLLVTVPDYVEGRALLAAPA